MKSKIADPSLASEGEKSFQWAGNHMQSLTKTIDKLKIEKPLEGRRVAVCLHVTKETSVLIMGLKALGADVSLAAANPLSTQNDIAAYLDSQGVNVYAWRGETSEEYGDCIVSILSHKPEIVMDDGSDAHVTIHEEKQFRGLSPLGGTEETTTGVTRLRALEKDGKLRYPVIAVNNAYTKYLFDNRYGTGQSTFDGILRATSLLVAGKRVVICGYGWVGKGIALRAKGLGASVYVTEVDPLRALEARMDGLEVTTMSNAAKIGDIFITTTGQTGVIRQEHFGLMRDGAILANAGHFDVEIDVRGLEAMVDPRGGQRVVRQNLEEFRLKGGKRLYLIAKGRIANLVAAEGHPPEVMALSFSNQLLSAVHIAKNHGKMQKKIHNVPEDIDRQVARNALEALGIEI
ncbi:MAG: adenosylhomocysteinase, partial [Thaumarchaeota archaeon]|nr:adenosylhomocysteinase [Nitrososphaerota archaeon]